MERLTLNRTTSERKTFEVCNWTWFGITVYSENIQARQLFGRKLLIIEWRVVIGRSLKLILMPAWVGMHTSFETHAFIRQVNCFVDYVMLNQIRVRYSFNNWYMLSVCW